MLARMPLTRRRTLASLAAGAATLGAPAWLRAATSVSADRFALGVASGQPRADGMVLWTRLAGDGLPDAVEVRWSVARDESMRDVVARGSETAHAADAHSVHAEPRGLEPGRWYWYRFDALGAASRVGRTRTAPADDASATLAFAIASCQRWDAGFYAAWRHLAAEPLDLVIFLGDYIYEYGARQGGVRATPGGAVRSLQDYRERYALHRSDPDLQAAHAAAPWLVVWDDHEVDNDYAALQGQDLDLGFAQRRAAAYRAYWEHMPLPKSARPRDVELRLYDRFAWGRLALVHLLDDRQYRDPQACPRPGRGGSNTVALKDCPSLLDERRSLLGAAQERWLADGWSRERAWNLLAQQTLMSRFSWRDPAVEPTYWTDGWDGYPRSRERLLRGMLAAQARNPVVLGGDVHTHYVADLKLDFDDPKSPVVASEFCGTSITSESLPQARIDAALPFNPHIRFGRGDRRGYMSFRLDARRLQCELRVLDDARRADSAIATAARFVVEDGRPGAQPG